MGARKPLPNPAAVSRASAAYGSAKYRLGEDHPTTQAPKVEVRVVRAEGLLAELVNSAPAPTAEQIERLRRLLPAVGTTSTGVAA